MKIAYIVDGLYNSAGMERVLTLKANALCGRMNVTFVIRNQMGRRPFFALDSRIRIIDVGAGSKEDYQTKLTEILKCEKFDICISTGGLEFYFLPAVKDGSKKIFEFHFSFDISQVWMAGVRNPLRRWLLVKGQTIRRVYLARKYDHVVVLSKTDLKKWKRFVPRLSYIYNPLTIAPSAISTCTEKQAIAVGRLDYQKGFDMLIASWKEVQGRHPDWMLRIYGEGTLRSKLQHQIDELGLSSAVRLEGRIEDIAGRYAESSIFILSSRDEAFGLVITEAESCGLPVVAFNCPSAPRELIDDGQNGYLVPLGDCHRMAERICGLIEHEAERQNMGRKSRELSAKFSLDRISQQWISLFNQICSGQ